MRIIHHAHELASGSRRVAVAIGTFDGVHLGHQQVLRQALSDARQHHAIAVAVTFDQHPRAVLHPEHAPPLIYSLNQKLRAIASLGIDSTLLIHFDQKFSQTPAEDFIRNLVHDFHHVYSICVGSRFTFGHRRTGNVTLLQSLGKELGFIVHGIAAVSLDEKVISSTRIRQVILAGDLDRAGQMLGRPYSLAGIVIRGGGLGRRLGFPTANLEVSGLVLPPHGVYAAQVQLDDQLHSAVLNIGVRPTFSQPKAQLHFEVHLLDFEQDLYGRELEVIFVEKLRDEKRFPSPDLLKDQIHQDIATARSLLQ